MTDWNRVVDEFFLAADPDGEYDRDAPAGASPAAIATAEAAIGVSLPEELRDFYASHDGLGLASRDGSESPRFVRPVSELPAFVEECRSSFEETHPAYAEKYLPFVDWNNGDSSGFVRAADGTWIEALFTFSHERYLYDAEQDVNEFLQPQADTVEEFLAPG